MRRPLLVPIAASIALSALVACGSDADTGTAASTTTSVSTQGESSTTAPSSTTSSTTGAPSGGLTGASEDPEAGPSTGTTVALLGNVRVARNDGFDRVVFEFTGDALPEWEVAYQDGPFTSDGEGAPVAVDGGAYLRVLMRGASGFDMDTGQQTYDGGDRIDGTASGAEQVVEVVRLGDFEAQMEWIVGLDEKVPFKVTTLTGPTRLVVDVAHSPA